VLYHDVGWGSEYASEPSFNEPIAGYETFDVKRTMRKQPPTPSSVRVVLVTTLPAGQVTGPPAPLQLRGKAPALPYSGGLTVLCRAAIQRAACRLQSGWELSDHLHLLS
jgi:hypothetical protein